MIWMRKRLETARPRLDRGRGLGSLSPSEAIGDRKSKYMSEKEKMRTTSTTPEAAASALPAGRPDAPEDPGREKDGMRVRIMLV